MKDYGMAWESIIYKCGHHEQEQFYGNHDERRDKAKWLAQADCPTCRAKDSKMTGTAKQVAWAESIRSQRIAEFEMIANNFLTQAATELAVTVINESLSNLVNNISASWWIRNRTTAADVLFRIEARAAAKAHHIVGA